MKNNSTVTLQELNALYSKDAKELIQKGRAHERAQLERVSAENYLSEPIPEGSARNLGVK